ncbi:MAG TPA: metallophosphoesterase [Actinomycetota bacterium]|nr:metallophosphoesterase [Actinomycetota bacterium]
MRRARDGRTTRLFYAADLHGSEPTFRKLVNAAAFYDADALVFGGDLMGKVLVPIVRWGGTFRARFLGADHELDADGLAPFVGSLETTGFYWKVMNPDEYEEVKSDPLAQRTLFCELAGERLASWLSLAEDRLAGTGVRLYLTGGNDDEPAVLEVLERHDGRVAIASEGRVVQVDGDHTMITVGLSTPTPWDTPREAGEDVIAEAIESAGARVPDPGRCVFNLHCPPKDTPLDTCLELERSPGELPRPVRRGGRFVTTGGGSAAVRRAIESYQPLVGLHGHVHESPGRFRIGRTQCFNPGSEYAQGILQGVLVSLRSGAVTGYQHTSG